MALSVVAAHGISVFKINLVGGPLAVQAFFIISGFYITLILNEKYVDVNNIYSLFISNRFLRLYPIYWSVLFLIIVSNFVVFYLSKGMNFHTFQL